MPLRPEDPPPDKPGADDPFAEFPAEPSAGGVDAPKDRDWFDEFPDEKSTPSPPVRSKSWRRLSESLKDEKG